MRNTVKKIIFRIIDILLLPFMLALLPLLKSIRRYGVQNFPLIRRSFLAMGVFPIRDHFYEPQFRFSDEFDASQKRKLPLDFQIERQLISLNELRYKNELASLAGIDNPNFAAGDGEMYYLLVRNKKPERIIEVGSGYSTLLAMEAIRKNRQEGFDTDMICIDPYETILSGTLEGVQFKRERVEKMDPRFFQLLGENDILFIDSSHIIRPENDVLFIYMEILPILNKGVFVHIHDIFTPRHYRQDWLDKLYRFWNEQYLLEAFLYHNDAFEIRYALNYLKNDYFEAMKKNLPHLTEASEPASFWLEKVK